MLIAGYAWKCPGKPCAKIDIGPFQSEDEFFAFYREQFGIPQDVSTLFSPHMRAVRSLLAWGLADSYNRFMGVLVIDSTQAQAFESGEVLEMIAFYIQFIQDQMEIAGAGAS